jgi:hypothetical protein
MNKRIKQFSFGTTFLVYIFGMGCGANAFQLTSESSIIAQVNAARPLNGGIVPADYAERIGITHYGGRYHLSDKPFLVEGMDNIQAMGFRSAKLWLSARSDQMRRGYYFNSTWSDTNSSTRLIDVAQHPDVHTVLSMDFDTILLEVNTKRGEEWRDAPDYGSEDYYTYLETEFYDLSRHLLETYADREITFILHNWAGDWMLQNKGSAGWTEWGLDPSGVPADVDQQVAGMINYFQARQAGVTRARADVSNTQAVVAHAIKMNQIWENIEESFPDYETTLEISTDPELYAYPSVLTHVVPYAGADMVVCAAYESKNEHPVKLWRTIELMRAFTPASTLYGTDNVAIGELGYRDNIPPLAASAVREYWDNTLGVVFAMNLPHCIFWELYANEAVDGNGEVIPTGNPDYYGVVFPEEDLRGFWLVKPDGTLSAAGEYFMEIFPAGADKVLARNTPGQWKDNTVWRTNNTVQNGLLPDHIDTVNLTSKVDGLVDLESGPVLLESLQVGSYERTSNDVVSLQLNAPLVVNGLTGIGSHPNPGAGKIVVSRPLISRTESLEVGTVSAGELTIDAGGVYEVSGGNAVLGPHGIITIRDGVLSIIGELSMDTAARLKLYGNSQLRVTGTDNLTQYITDGLISGAELPGNVLVVSDGTITTLSVDVSYTAVAVGNTTVVGSGMVLEMGTSAAGMKVLYAPDLYSEFDEEVKGAVVNGEQIIIPEEVPQRQEPQGFFRVIGP